jgi:hypothetical protein
MSLGSPADIVPFKRFLERRQRLDRIAAASFTIATPAPTDGGTARGDQKANDDSGVSPGASATVHATTPDGGCATLPQSSSSH